MREFSSTSGAIKIGALSVLLAALFFIFFSFDPAGVPIFPKCPFLLLTGCECPGCGSQRALHSLFHLQIGRAIRENALLVAFIPYAALGIYLEYFGGKKLFPRLLSFFFGKGAIIAWLILIFSFWIGRNVA